MKNDLIALNIDETKIDQIIETQRNYYEKKRAGTKFEIRPVSLIPPRDSIGNSHQSI